MTFKKTFIYNSGAFIYVTIFFLKLYNLVGIGRFNFGVGLVSNTAVILFTEFK